MSYSLPLLMRATCLANNQRCEASDKGRIRGDDLGPSRCRHPRRSLLIDVTVSLCQQPPKTVPSGRNREPVLDAADRLATPNPYPNTLARLCCC